MLKGSQTLTVSSWPAVKTLKSWEPFTPCIGSRHQDLHAMITCPYGHGGETRYHSFGYLSVLTAYMNMRGTTYTYKDCNCSCG